jgi:hypothetical protein
MFLPLKKGEKIECIFSVVSNVVTSTNTMKHGKLLLTFCIYIMIELEETTANCRDLGDDFDVDFGNLYPPNPLRLEANTGVITSSNYPSKYNPNEQCGFIIEAPEGSRLVHHIY